MGKTSVIKIVCKLLNWHCTSFVFSKDVTVEDLFGTFLPSSDGSVRLVPGKLAMALSDPCPHVFLADELNLGSSEVRVGR